MVVLLLGKELTGLTDVGGRGKGKLWVVMRTCLKELTLKPRIAKEERTARSGAGEP